ncbi:hypothetical protein VNO77_33129 [Canavalia gladiata]|uniref:Uncharacterized protein n=1 Tax=Canavalia gladiata TaxID=3824 RepID=A0AAN9KEC6_CANGL
MNDMHLYVVIWDIIAALCCLFFLDEILHSFQQRPFGMLPGDMQGKGHLLSETNIAVSSLGILCNQELLKIKQTD